MKKRYLAAIIAGALLTTNVYAGSATLDVDKTEVGLGDTFTATVKVNTSSWAIKVKAIGDVDLEKCLVDGKEPIGEAALNNNLLINEADATTTSSDKEQVFSITCPTKAVGNIQLILTGNNEDANGDFHLYSAECDETNAKECTTLGTDTTIKKAVTVTRKKAEPTEPEYKEETPGESNTTETTESTDKKDNKKDIKENPKTGVFSYLWTLPVIGVGAYIALKVNKSKRLFK